MDSFFVFCRGNILIVSWFFIGDILIVSWFGEGEPNDSFLGLL